MYVDVTMIMIDFNNLLIDLQSECSLLGASLLENDKPFVPQILIVGIGCLDSVDFFSFYYKDIDNTHQDQLFIIRFIILYKVDSKQG